MEFLGLLKSYANINFIEDLAFVQDYEYVQHRQWMLSKEILVVNLAPNETKNKETTGFIGRKTTFYRNFVLEEPKDEKWFRETNEVVMQEDAYNIPKPKDTDLVVPTLLFVPCLGYGPGGYRLGYGGGFYDRTLASLQPKPFTVGLGYTHGFLPELMPEPHDVPLDAVLNDNGVVWPIS